MSSCAGIWGSMCCMVGDIHSILEGSVGLGTWDTVNGGVGARWLEAATAPPSSVPSSHYSLTALVSSPSTGR